MTGRIFGLAASEVLSLPPQLSAPIASPARPFTDRVEGRLPPSLPRLARIISSLKIRRTRAENLMPIAEELRSFGLVDSIQVDYYFSLGDDHSIWFFRMI